MEKIVSIRLQIFITVAGVAIAVFNLWIASKLAPLASDIGSLAARVQAMEQYQGENKPLIERFYKLEEKTANIEKKLDTIEDKVDVIIGQHIELRNRLSQ